MDLVRQNKRAFAAIAAGVVVIVLVLLVTFVHNHAASSGGTVIGNPSAVAPEPGVEAVVGRSGQTGTRHGHARKQALSAASGLPAAAPGLLGTGGEHGLTPHRVVIAAGSDGPLLGVGWAIPTADGTRAGKDLSYQDSFRHEATAYGNPAYAELYTRVGPNSSTVWCTVTVDGRVTERRVGHGPWADVFCLG